MSLIGQSVEHYAGVSTISGFQNGDKNNALLNNPHGIDVDQFGNVYIADRYNHAIRKISLSGEVTTLAGTGISGNRDGIADSATFNEPWDVAVDNTGNVFVADAKNNKIRKISTTGVVSTYAGTGNAGFTDNTNPLVASFFWPSGIDFDHETEKIYVAGHLSHLVRTIDKNGTVSTLAGSKNNFPNNFGSDDGFRSSAKFYRPYGIHIARDGYVYVADEWNSLIRRMTKEGVVETVAGQPQDAGFNDGGKDTSSFNFPWGITSDRMGNVYVLDGFNHVIRKINPNTLESELFAGVLETTGAKNASLLESTFNGATGIQYAEKIGSLLIADAYNHVIRQIKLLEPINLTLDKTPTCSSDTVLAKIDLDFYDTYYWFQGNKLLAVTDTNSVNLQFESDGDFFVRAERTGAGIVVSDTIAIEIPIATNVLVKSIPTSPCVGNPALLTTENQKIVTWFNNTVSDTVTVRETGEYAYKYINDQGCELLGTVEVLFNELPQLTILQEVIGDSVLLTASGAQNYRWSTGEIVNPIVVYKSSVYEVFGVSNEGCQASQTTKVESVEHFILANNDTLKIKDIGVYTIPVTENDQIADGVSVFLESSSNDTFKLSIKDKKVIVEFLEFPKDQVNIPYSICLTSDIRTCSRANLVIVPNDNPWNDLIIPSGFTPNNDLVNDFFEIVGVEYLEEHQLVIFNRWGQEVFSNINYINQWGGVNKDGQPLPEGTYFYVLKSLLNNNKKSGYVVIHR